MSDAIKRKTRARLSPPIDKNCSAVTIEILAVVKIKRTMDEDGNGVIDLFERGWWGEFGERG